MLDYKIFFGFQDEPFRLTPDTQYFFPSRSHQGALEALKYVFQSNEGFAIILGEAGVGKTLVLRLALKEMPPNKEVAVLLTPNLNPTELLVAILRDLKVLVEGEIPSKDQLIKVFSDYLLKEAERDKGVIIVIDEAQNLPIESLEQLRLLSNLETEKRKLLQIVLIGQPELLEKINDKKLRQLNQRITVKEKLEPFTYNETMDYLFFRLSKAGRGNLTVKRGAIKLAHRLSGGIPRKINALFSRALLLAYSEEKTVINKGYIKTAYNTLVLEGEKRAVRRIPYLLIPLVLVLVIGISALVVLNRGYRVKPTPAHTQGKPPQQRMASSTKEEGPPSPLPPVQAASDQELYLRGYELLTKGEVEKAREQFQKLVKEFPESFLADNALYWLGESYYAQKDWERACLYFSRILSDYPQGNKVPDALLKRALTYWNESKWEEARGDLLSILTRYPHLGIAEKARKKLQDLDKINIQEKGGE